MTAPDLSGAALSYEAVNGSRENPLWFLPAPSSRYLPPLAGSAAGVKFLLLHLPHCDLR
jgi:hypothetical protein